MASAEDAAPAPKPAPTAAGWIDWLVPLAVAVGTLAVLVGPLLWLAGEEQAAPATPAGHPAESTVGIAVILRAAFRRMFRSGLQNLLEAGVGTFSQAGVRMIVRRLVRVTVRSSAFTLKEAWRADAAAGGAPAIVSGQRPLVALALGLPALFLSLLGVLLLVPAEVSAAVLGPLALGVGALLGTLPLLAYALLAAAGCRLWGAQFYCRTGLDGLLIQGYFTGAGSFLPLTTEIDYEGLPAATARVAVFSLGGLFLLHLVLLGLGRWLDAPALRFAAAMMLLYCFVYTFPLRPLDGRHLWARSRWLWLAAFLPVLAAFIFDLPESFNGIL